MYKYRYIHDVPVMFPDLRFIPHKGYVHQSKILIDHPYWELIEPEQHQETIELESPSDTADKMTKES